MLKVVVPSAHGSWLLIVLRSVRAALRFQQLVTRFSLFTTFCADFTVSIKLIIYFGVSLGGLIGHTLEYFL